MTLAAICYDLWQAKCRKSLMFKEMWLGPESNRRHVDFQSTALPTELPSLLPMKIAIFSGNEKLSLTLY
jgi:hypothetical protein